MTLLSVSEVRDHVETGLGDSALQMLVEAADADVVRYAGQHDPMGRTYSRTLDAARNTTILLPHKAQTITSVALEGDALDASDYELEHDGLTLRVWFQRPYNWTAGRYARYVWEITVTYNAADDRPQRKRALVQLVRLAVQHDGLASERVGDYSRSSADYGKERKRILAALRSPHARLA